MRFKARVKKLEAAAGIENGDPDDWWYASLTDEAADQIIANFRVALEYTTDPVNAAHYASEIERLTAEFKRRGLGSME